MSKKIIAILSPRHKEGLFFLIGLLGVWTVLSTQFSFAADYLFPTPIAVASALWENLPELLEGTVSSFLVLLPAFLTATLLGVILGIIAGTTPWVNRLLGPFSRFAAPIPTTIYIPYAIALLPSFESAAGFVIFIGAFWPIFLNTTTGAAHVPAHFRENAQTLELGRFEYRIKIVLPSALPHIFSGLSIGLVFSFILLTVAELFGASSGLGRFVQLSADYAEYTRMVAGILYVGIVVFLCSAFLDALKHRLIFWKKL
jgi:NitT/TauT family transport system permease protein